MDPATVFKEFKKKYSRTIRISGDNKTLLMVHNEPSALSQFDEDMLEFFEVCYPGGKGSSKAPVPQGAQFSFASVASDSYATLEMLLVASHVSRAKIQEAKKRKPFLMFTILVTDQPPSRISKMNYETYVDHTIAYFGTYDSGKYLIKDINDLTYDVSHKVKKDSEGKRMNIAEFGTFYQIAIDSIFNIESVPIPKKRNTSNIERTEALTEHMTPEGVVDIERELPSVVSSFLTAKSTYYVSNAFFIPFNAWNNFFAIKTLNIDNKLVITPAFLKHAATYFNLISFGIIDSSTPFKDYISKQIDNNDDLIEKITNAPGMNEDKKAALIESIQSKSFNIPRPEFFLTQTQFGEGLKLAGGRMLKQKPVPYLSGKGNSYLFQE